MVTGGGRRAGPSRPWWLWPAVAAAGVAGAAALVAGGGARGPDLAAPASRLTATAPPAATVGVFLAAWSRNDRATMRALSTEAFWRGFSAIRGGSTTFRDVTVTLTRPRPAGDRSRSADVRGHAEVTHVLVEATIRQRPVATWTDGRHPWGFEVVRDRAGERWLIGSQGLG